MIEMAMKSWSLGHFNALAARHFWKYFDKTPVTFNDVLITVYSRENHVVIKAQTEIGLRLFTHSRYVGKRELRDFPLAYNYHFVVALEGLGKYIRKQEK
jgi:hypothetical protein